MKYPRIFKSVGSNFTWLVTGQLIYKLFSLISLILLVRHITIKEFGIFSYSLAYIGLFYALPDLGLSDLLVRETAKRRHLVSKYFNNFFSLKLFLSLITLTVIGASAVLHSYNTRISYLLLIFGIGIVLESLNFLIKAVFQAHEQMRYEAYSLIIEGVIRLLLVLLALNKGIGIIGIAFAFFVSTLFGLIVSGLLVNLRFIKFKFEFNRKFILKHFITALPFAGLYLFGYLNLKIDIVMLLHLSGEASTGLYGAANRLVEPLLAIPIMFGISLAPAISNAIEWKANDVIYFLRKSIILAVFFYFPIAVSLIFAAPMIFKVIFGPSYINAIGVFRFLICFFPLFALQISWEKLLNGLRREWITVGIYFSGAMLNVIFNVLLIPKYDFIGAAIGTLLAQGLILVGLFCFIRFVHLQRVTSKDFYLYGNISSLSLRGHDA